MSIFSFDSEFQVHSVNYLDSDPFDGEFGRHVSLFESVSDQRDSGVNEFSVFSGDFGEVEVLESSVYLFFLHRLLLEGVFSGLYKFSYLGSVGPGLNVYVDFVVQEFSLFVLENGFQEVVLSGD